MSVAYVDSSVVVAIAFGEPGAAGMQERLAEFTTIVASSLLEAELRSVCRRERREVSQMILDQMVWLAPARALSEEISRVLDAGYVRGADCFHLANALFVAPDTNGVVFITLDRRQREVAAALGFET